MGYIHCCGGLRRTRTFSLAPQENYILCEVDYLEKCPVCGHRVVQLTRVDINKKLSVIRKVNSKAEAFFQKLKKNLICELKPISYSKQAGSKFYLNYNEFGVKKRCYSNLRSLKIGLVENCELKNKSIII